MLKVIVIIFTLFTSSYAVVLECEFSLERWPLVGDKYSCVTSLSEVSTNQRVTNVSGDHLSGQNYSNVESIKFDGCAGSTFIPRDLLKFFPNLIGIQMISCGNLTLNGNELNEYQSLQLFAIESTRLERIPGNFFASTPQITVAGFAYNNLKHVGSKLLQSLTNLSWISFSANDCINQTATTREEIPSLISNLRDNCIDIFEETTSTTSTTEMSSTESTTEEEEEETTTPSGSGSVMMDFILILVLLMIVNFQESVA